MFARQNHHPHPSQEPLHLLELKLGIHWTIRHHSSPPSAPGDHCLTFCLWMCLACFYVQFGLQHTRLTLWQSESVHIYVFFSKMICHRVLHILPRVLYQGLVVYPFSFWRLQLKWKSLSRVRLFATPWPLPSMKFSRPEYWSGQPCPSPGNPPHPGMEPRSPTLQADSLPAEPPGKPKDAGVSSLSLLQRIFQITSISI